MGAAHSPAPAGGICCEVCLKISHKLRFSPSALSKTNCSNNFNCKINPREKILGSEVNKWVFEETNGLIDKLIEEDDEYSILLANALYYKAKWQVDFKKKSDEQEFYLESGDSTKRFNPSINAIL